MPPKKRTSAGKAKAKPSGDAAAPDPPFSGADAAWKEVGVRVERIKKAGAWVAAGSEPTGIPRLSSLPSDWEGASVPISDVRPGSKASLVPSVGRIQNDPGMLRAARLVELPVFQSLQLFCILHQLPFVLCQLACQSVRGTMKKGGPKLRSLPLQHCSEVALSLSRTLSGRGLNDLVHAVQDFRGLCSRH